MLPDSNAKSGNVLADHGGRTPTFIDCGEAQPRTRPAVKSASGPIVITMTTLGRKAKFCLSGGSCHLDDNRRRPRCFRAPAQIAEVVRLSSPRPNGRPTGDACSPAPIRRLNSLNPFDLRAEIVERTGPPLRRSRDRHFRLGCQLGVGLHDIQPGATNHLGKRHFGVGTK